MNERNPAGIRGRIIVAIIVALVLSFAPATTAGAAESGHTVDAPGEPAGFDAPLESMQPGDADDASGETIFALTDALALARRHGPGFAQVRLRAQARELESALSDADKAPRLTVSGRTALHPDPGQNVRADFQWNFHEHLTLSALVDRTWAVGTRAGAGSAVGGAGSSAGGLSETVTSGSGDNVTLSFHYKLWPRTDADFDERIRQLEERIAENDEYDAEFTAHVDIIDAFHDFEHAGRAEAIAAARLELADSRTELVEAAFAAGDEGLSALQDAQQAERQALVAQRDATAARSRAEVRLRRLLGDGSEDVLLGGGSKGALEGVSRDVSEGVLLNGLPDGMAGEAVGLVDDLDWSAFVATVQDVLEEDTDAVLGRLIASDEAYLNAELAELRTAKQFAEAGADRGVQWHADAAYRVPFGNGASGAGGGSGSDPGANAGGVSGSGPRKDSSGLDGQFTAFVGASWEWGTHGNVHVEQAKVAFESAKLTTRTAREAAIDAAEAALRALDDTAFAKEVAQRGSDQAATMLEIVERRVKLGLAGPLEFAQARLDVQRTRAELLAATDAWHRAWLEVGRRLGLPLPRGR